MANRRHMSKENQRASTPLTRRERVGKFISVLFSDEGKVAANYHGEQGKQLGTMIAKAAFPTEAALIFLVQLLLNCYFIFQGWCSALPLRLDPLAGFIDRPARDPSQMSASVFGSVLFLMPSHSQVQFLGNICRLLAFPLESTDDLLVYMEMIVLCIFLVISVIALFGSMNDVSFPHILALLTGESSWFMLLSRTLTLCEQVLTRRSRFLLLVFFSSPYLSFFPSGELLC